MSTDSAAPPRICVVTSGQARIFRTCTDLLKRQLGVAEHPIDFHALFWDDADLDKTREALAGFRETTLWTHPRVQFNEDFSAYAKPPETNVHNFLSMIWGRRLLLDKLREAGAFERYDLFVFVRLDTCFNRPLDYAAIASLLQQHSALLPVNGHWRDGWSDQFFAGRSAALQTWLGFADRVKGYLAEGVLLHPETLLKHHMVSNGLHAAPLITTFIWRSDVVFNVG
jgi:hypothetical protein